MQSVDILGYSISAQGLDADAEHALRIIMSNEATHHVACANPHSFVVAAKDKEFQHALAHSDLLLPDGAGIVMAAKLLRQDLPGRVAGSEFFMKLSELAQRAGEIKYFFLGASEYVLERIVERLGSDFPAIEVCGVYSPPFKDEFSIEDNREMIEKINAAGSHVLWVGMTAPKQEKWVESNRAYLKVPLVCSIGAAFDFYAGTKKRAPKWLCDMGLEWLPRLLREPRRLWQRNFVSTPVFLVNVLAQKLGLPQTIRRKISS